VSLRAARQRIQVVEAFEAQHLACEHEGVAGAQLLDEPFLDLAQHPPRRQGSPPAAVADPDEAHLQHLRFDDRADVQAIALGQARVRDAQPPVGHDLELGILVVGLERVAAGGHERHRLVEVGAAQPAIGPGASHLVVEFVGVERSGAGHAEDVLGQHVALEFGRRLGVLGAVGGGRPGGLAFEHLEAVGRHQQSARRRVEAVVGAPDALQDAARALGRADIDDEIDVAPVDAEVERRGAHDGAQFPAAIAASTLRRWPVSSEP
jgi:hypothetical protein